MPRFSSSSPLLYVSIPLLMVLEFTAGCLQSTMQQYQVLKFVTARGNVVG
jgi:hypothetical protein